MGLQGWLPQVATKFSFFFRLAVLGFGGTNESEFVDSRKRVAVNTAIAVFGTAVVESPLARAFRPHSGFDVIRREWITSLVLAEPLGFFVQCSWKGGAARWSWIIPSVFFFPWVLLHLPTGHAVSRFSGYDCATQLGGLGCRDFLVFTIPFVRGVAYSAMAVLANRVKSLRGDGMSAS
jgi:hypothetical protein